MTHLLLKKEYLKQMKFWLMKLNNQLVQEDKIHLDNHIWKHLNLATEGWCQRKNQPVLAKILIAWSLQSLIEDQPLNTNKKMNYQTIMEALQENPFLRWKKYHQ